MTRQNNLIRYPIYSDSHPYRLYDVVVTMLETGVLFCKVCGKITRFVIQGDNLRETCTCVRCHSSNRQRQIAFVLCSTISTILGRNIRSLRELKNVHSLSFYNTEAMGALHNELKDMTEYVSSEYFGPDYTSGSLVKGMLHEDLMKLSFNDESFDIVISSDVIEHMPVPYHAHKEIYRVLKIGGRHIFTVPFYQTEYLDEQRAWIDDFGKTIFLKEPMYHGDPLRTEGVLVFNIFSLQMLVELRKIGFRTNMYSFYKPFYGIIGNNAIVFEAIKE